MRYLNKVIFLNSAHIPYAEIRMDGNVHFIGTQGVGKSTLLRAILFFYNADKLHLGIPKEKQNFDAFYLPYANSYIVYEVVRENSAYSVVVSKSMGRAAFRLIDAPYRKAWFVNDRHEVSADWSEVRTRILESDARCTKGIVQIFLKKGGIDVDKRDVEGNTPLYHACLKGFRDIVNLLLDSDADVSIANNCSETPLHAVARNGNKEIIGKLIQYGADLDATDNEGRTPLIRLLDNKRTDAALFLIEQGADTEITDNSGHKAIDYATAHGLKEVVIRLIVDGTSDIQGNTPLHQAVFNGQSEIVCLLLSTSPDMIDVTNDAGETPLLIACMKGNLTIVNLLIDAGAEVNKALLNGNTPLHFAAGFGNKFIGNSLIAAQALVNVKNKNGETPLILASREGNNEFVALLVAHGADVNLVDNFQQTALYYAGERGYNEIVETLLMAGAEG